MGLPPFSRRYCEYLSEDEYRLLQETIAGNPLAGDMMPGTGGFRKVRWADPNEARGGAAA